MGTPKKRAIVAFVLSLVLAGGASGSSAFAAGDTSSGPATSVSGVNRQALSGPQVRTHGNFQVTSTNAGSTIVWTPKDPLDLTDDRPQFYVNGQSVGAALGSENSFRLQLPGVATVQPQSLSVVRSGEVLDGAPLGLPTKQPKAKKKAVAVSQPSKIVKKDPGKRGKYKTTSFTYRDAGIRVPGYATKLEVKGVAVAPVGAKGKLPVVVFLHGRHSTCYYKKEASGDWPCIAPQKSIPSYQGYRYQQDLLASQGYMTVSISANSINAQDGEQLDSGSGARAELLRHHLNILAGWNSGTATSPVGAPSFKDRLVMSKVMTVGHSRGGEGVNRLAVQAKPGDPYRIVGQVLVAPTDFARQVAVGVPTTVLLPYCDGDVSDLQGQQYVDQGARLVSGDHSLKTAALVMGANHNFFNTQWTPGQAVAPSDDDWMGGEGEKCSGKSASRLTFKEQQAVGATYVAAAAQAYLKGGKDAIRMLDGTQVRAKSAGRAVVLTTATGGKRRGVIVPSATTKVTATWNATSAICSGYAHPANVGKVCSSRGSLTSPHWLSGSWSGGGVPAPQAWKVTWSKRGAEARVNQQSDLHGRPYFDLRVVADPSVRANRFNVVLKDSTGKTQTLRPESQPADLPRRVAGVEYVAQQIRVALPKKSKVNLSKITSISIKGVSSAGKIYILDGVASAKGMAKSSASVRSTPTLNVLSAEVTTDPNLATQQVWVTVPVQGTTNKSGSVWVEVSDQSALAPVVGQAYAITPGLSELRIPLSVSGDDVYKPQSADYSPGGYHVTVTALRNAVVDNYVGVLDVKSTAPRPSLTALDSTATASKGTSLRWILQLSGPISEELSLSAEAQAPASAELLIADTVPAWAAGILGSSGGTKTLSEAQVRLDASVTAYGTTAVIEIPIRRLATMTSARYVKLVIPADGEYVTAPITLTGTVTP